jgi:hypothetical protein
MATDDDAEAGEKTLFQACGFESLAPMLTVMTDGGWKTEYPYNEKGSWFLF